MRKKIRNKLSMKVFLWVFSALTICSGLIYGIVMAVVPQQYQFISDSQLEENIDTFFACLEEMTYDEAVGEIYNFCINHNATAILTSQNVTLTFGEMEAKETGLTTANFAAAITFSDRKEEVTLIVSSLSQTADHISALFRKLIPAIFGLIVFLSVISALICSKVIVAPIAKISQISRRMTLLDMTWRCDIESDDEIGVLAASLNTMAGRLQATMEDLESANRQLTADVRKFQTLEVQRRNFFAAVSHELKTPLTILKGQIENMILGYGDYRNHEKYLPEALKAADDMEYLVKEIIAISKMESMDLQDTRQDISLLDSVNDRIAAIGPLAENKHIRIHQKISADRVVSVNTGLWDKALSNIIGNAVAHSPGGEDIFISLQSGDCGTALIIENTGVFISKEDLPHLFTPFYRADKSRNRETGGSGLGLYIVKTILDLHGMAYCIKNTQRGVAFFLYLDG